MTGRKVKERKKLLWVGDAQIQTGFARVTHSVLDRLSKYYEVHVLGVNYRGDPHDYNYKIYPAVLGGDLHGFNRLGKLMVTIQPDILCILNDPWVVSNYAVIIKQVMNDPSYTKKTKIFFYMPVDAHNIMPQYIQGLKIADVNIGYTHFGINELIKSGLDTKVAVIPHGHDSEVFYPVDRAQARSQLSNGRMPEEWYIVGNTNRNQPRKRLDLLVEYFAEFAQDKPDHVKLMYHGVLHDTGWNIVDLARYYGIGERLVFTNLHQTMDTLPTRDVLRLIYNSMDVYASTTQGEG